MASLPARPPKPGTGRASHPVAGLRHVQCDDFPAASKAFSAAEANLEHPPDGGAFRQDDYTRWYLQDADRVLHTESYERGYHHHRRIKVVCALLRRAGVRRVLDLGCGDGWQVGRLVRAGFEVTGSDISPLRLRRARGHAPGARGFFVSDLRRPAILEASLECIYLGQVLEHLPEPEAVLRSLWSSLRPGGFLIFDTPCRDNPVDDLIRISGLQARYPAVLDWGLQVDPGHLHFFTLPQIVAIVGRSGYSLICSRGAPRLRWNIPRVGNVFAAHRVLWKVHDLLEWALGCLPRYRDSGAIVVCLARRPLSAGAITRSPVGAAPAPGTSPA